MHEAHVQEGTQNRNDSKASTTSKEMLKVSNVYVPREKVAERSAKLAGLHRRLPCATGFLRGISPGSTSPDVSIKNCSDPKEREHK